jgi:polyisoprenyl-phosphate glycosyltransferase
MPENKLVSIVVPVYNSELSLPELAERIHITLTRSHIPYEVIFVDDGSKDKSWEKLEIIEVTYPCVIKAFKLKKNTGQQNATFFGLTKAKGDLVITIDDDLQFPPEEIIRLVDECDKTKADIVYGVYQKDYLTSLRSILRVFFKILTFIIFGPNRSSSFRAIKKELINKILNNNNPIRVIDLLIKNQYPKIQYLKVNHCKRKYSASNYTIASLIRLSVHILTIYSVFSTRMILYSISAGIIFLAILSTRFIFQEMFYIPAITFLLISMITLATLIFIIGLTETCLLFYKKKLIATSSCNFETEKQICS